MPVGYRRTCNQQLDNGEVAIKLTRFRIINSLIGHLTVAGQADCLTNLVIEGSAHPPPERSRWIEDPEAFPDVVAQLSAYFAGKRSAFDVTLRPDGTNFQRRVWDALGEIPYGETRTYAEIARRIGQPGAARAVGLANGRNPIAIIIPCHRVIGVNGSLTGYSGGLQAKQALLNLEHAGHATRPDP